MIFLFWPLIFCAQNDIDFFCIEYSAKLGIAIIGHFSYKKAHNKPLVECFQSHRQLQVKAVIVLFLFRVYCFDDHKFFLWCWSYWFKFFCEEDLSCQFYFWFFDFIHCECPCWMSNCVFFVLFSGASDGNQVVSKVQLELEQMQKQRQRLLEAEEEAKKGQLLNKLKNIEAKQTANHNSSFSFTPSTPGPKSYNREPIPQYSRQNSTNNHDYRSNHTNKTNNVASDAISREVSMKREDTDSQLAAILGTDLRCNRSRRRKDVSQTKEKNHEPFLDQPVVDSNRSGRSRQKTQNNISSSPFLERQKSDRISMKTDNQMKSKFNNQSPVVHDDIEELLL